MWKYVTGCVKETLQRGVNYFDVRCGAGLASNQTTSVVPRKDNAVKSYQENYRCSDNSDHTNTRKNDYNWYHDRLANPWINAFSWSGAIVLGWYTSQLLGLSQKRRRWFEKEFKGRQCFLRSNTKALRSALLSCAFTQPPPSITQQVINNSFFNETSSTTVPYNVSNEKDLSNVDRKQDNEVGLDDAIKDLTGVLSSVENQLGLVAIEGGDLREGLAMLHSAAQRNHAPALYNLAICYEKGLGMKKNEKMAAELYSAAASLNHPTALYNLAVFQGQGRGGLDRDPMAAEKLLRQAAAKGQEDAIRLLRGGQAKTESNKPVLKGEAFSPPNKTPTEAFLDFIAGNEIPTRHQQSVLIY